ncbi:uncharacterized protein LOC124461040 [Drosophila willistoni]|uniref:uncharacterized protein LOC124461040 n=1 Tax=Drosophila willistoni TaxID=7260 RepID=UPI001F084FF1|nr:uncharacterized protein LOC124461040 [Drosophila willistoni]
MQEENRKTFNKCRKSASEYEVDELVAVKRTQFGSGLKLKGKYLGPYRVVRKMRHGRYSVEKVGDGEGPKGTTTVAEYMKKWCPTFGANVEVGWPNVGSRYGRGDFE